MIHDSWELFGMDPNTAGRSRLTIVLGFGKRRFRVRVWRTLALAAVLVALAGSGYRYGEPSSPERSVGGLPTDPDELKRVYAKLVRDKKRLEGALAREAPHGVYIVVDQTQNRLYLKRGDVVLLKAVCSAGSGMVLRESEEGRGRRWVFDTPRGLFHVRNKVENPVWKKPDWAFVEEGKPIPRNPEDRFEYGTLGEYGLYLGDGYLIHGTLYERLLGRSVTHGCIRLGREDLRKVWRLAPIGTAVYIH